MSIYNLMAEYIVASPEQQAAIDSGGKPVVHYTFQHDDIEEGKRAYIGGVLNHYIPGNVRYGANFVTTSKVVKVDQATGDFETLNTRYVKVVAPDSAEG